MTEISIAYCSSHAPMMAAARDSAEENQRNRFFGALEIIRDDARRAGVQACVVLSNEHFTNFFLENFPQICVGVGERNWGPTEAWLPISKAWIPGHPGLAGHITRSLLNTGFDPAFSHQLELDHGVMTVYHELDPQLQLPLVPITRSSYATPSRWPPSRPRTCRRRRPARSCGTTRPGCSAWSERRRRRGAR